MSILKGKEKIRTIFMGTPEFSLPYLKALINDNQFEVVAVYTQPDKLVGRQRQLKSPAIKTLAIENNLKVFQPEKIKTETQNIKQLNPDLIIVVAYGKIIPQEILDIPQYNCLNVHASLLPKYRGASCLNAPILNGDEKSGLSIMKMEAGLDTGPILNQVEISLDKKEILKSLHDKLSTLGANILIPTIISWIKGEIKEKRQDENKASYVEILKKEDGKLELTKNAIDLERVIRAFNPWPGTYILLDNDVLKIVEAEVVIKTNKNHKVGEIFKENNRLLLACGQNYLDILKLQLSGKKILSAKEFLNGKPDIVGKIVR